MKKVAFLMLILAGYLGAQSFYVDCPTIMVRDTIVTGTSDSLLIYFNPQNNPNSVPTALGPVDLHVRATGYSTPSGTDTLHLSVRGIKRKLLEGSTTWTNYYGDSTYVGGAENDSTLHEFAIDPLYIYYFNFDGLSVKFDQNGTDTDTVRFWVNTRVWAQGGIR
jgi:hypothetical protein